MESSTKILRRLLDERGGFRVDFDREGARRTCWKIDDEQDGYCYFDEDAFGVTQLTITGITPEQAIATLGSCNCSDNCTNGERTETCHPIISDNLNESEGMGDAWADCSECGHLLFVLTDPNSEPPNFCPNCGAKVIEPTTNDVDAEVDA